MLSVCASTHPGAVRTINEDAALWDPELSFLAVADGMGGHNAGEVAARLAIDSVSAFLQKSTANQDFTWPFGVNPTLSFSANRVTTAVQVANRRVFRASEERAEYTGMGTTLVLALAEDAHVTFANVGDSRLYTMRDAQLVQLSRDDSWVTMLAHELGLDPGSLHDHAMRHVLTNVVGARPELEVALGEFDLEDGQLILLCTDGVHGGVPDDQLAAILAASVDLQRTADEVVETAVRQDGRDNATLILARYAADPP